MRRFEVVRDDCRKHPNMEIKLPQRATAGSMGYDFYSPDEYMVYPNNVVKIWSDVHAVMNKDEGLLLNIRSSMGGRFSLLNTLGVIDSDYINGNNNGNVGIFLQNVSDETQYIHKGDAIAQGIFLKYLITDDDNATAERTGGFGSTGS